MSINSVTDSLLARYREVNNRIRPFIVGVDGLGGAGKTTLVSNLKNNLEDKGYEIIILHMDDYIVESKKRYETGFEEWYEYYYLQWHIKFVANRAI